MEEELNENELEERFYSMLHYVDDSQTNANNYQDALKLVENAPRSTIKRYWRTSGDHAPTTPVNTSYKKVNILKEKVNIPNEKVNIPKDKVIALKEDPISITPPEDTKPKDLVKIAQEPLPKHLSLFQAPVPEDVKKTIEILENDDEVVVDLESSDDDEVVEVALPPKPTITIESSDDETPRNDTLTKDKGTTKQDKNSSNGQREISTSPVPSIVSSVSDDFIRSDCIAFNISSRHPNNKSFDFSLHGVDIHPSILDTPSKKKKKKKNKETSTSTPITLETTPTKQVVVEEYFATPKSKAKNKKQKNKSYTVKEKSMPNADVYDSDSNQSILDITNNNRDTYVVTEKSLPSADVYETDFNQSEIPRHQKSDAVIASNEVDSSDSSISLDKTQNEIPKSIEKETPQITEISIDLTATAPDEKTIQESIVMGNVTGFTESEDYCDIPPDSVANPQSILGSTKVPAILYDNLDFDNLKGKEKVCKNRRYSLKTLRAEMEKFYNESWGGEDFNHREIQKNMSRDKSLWAIDPKDRMGSLTRKKFNTCNYCNRQGHRDDMCRLRPRVCFMCGNPGHMEPRCPQKICVNCGSPNYMYSTMCRNCCGWGRITCAECGQRGHPASHCPDIWRRYHNTVDLTPNLEENRFTKRHCQLFCSGCTRRGHLIHTCRLSLPFSGLPINSPYVHIYRPVYAPVPYTTVHDQNQYNQRNQPQFKSFQDSTISSASQPIQNDRNKRQSKSPSLHETHVNKKRNMSLSEIPAETPKTPAGQELQRKRSHSQSKEPVEGSDKLSNQKEISLETMTFETIEKAPDFIPIGSSSNNHDKQGLVIQDNEVSDTSDVVTSARIYVTNEIINQLKTPEGAQWLNETAEKLHVKIEETENSSFLSIKGKLGDQEAFQLALRDWAKDKPSCQNEKEADVPKTPENNQSYSDNIPKNRDKILRKLSDALDSLKENIGEPGKLYKELNYLQNRHQELLRQKVVSPSALDNNRHHIKDMLRKLNIVLIGQAGLAGGSKHINELKSLQEKLIHLRTKNVTLEMRKNIGEHFHMIFTATPRQDYSQLIQAYYTQKQKKKSFKKNKPCNSTNPQKNSDPKKFDTIPTQNQQNDIPEMVLSTENETVKNETCKKKKAKGKKFLPKQYLHKLTFFRRRLMGTRPHDNVLKKTRTELVRKLHVFIGSLGSNPNITSKKIKKIKKVQEQAQLFLNNDMLKCN